MPAASEPTATAPVNPHRRNELVGLIGEAIMDGQWQHPPFPMMPSEVAWLVAGEIAQRLEAQGVRLDGAP